MKLLVIVQTKGEGPHYPRIDSALAQYRDEVNRNNAALPPRASEVGLTRGPNLFISDTGVRVTELVIVDRSGRSKRERQLMCRLSRLLTAVQQCAVRRLKRLAQPMKRRPT